MPNHRSNPDPPSVAPADEPSDGLPTIQEVVGRLDRLWADHEIPAPSPFASLAGTRLGPYVIERIIGRGGFGIVYKARDSLLNRDVALKIPRPEVLLDDDRLIRFEAEATATAQLDHPSIVPLYEAQLKGVTPYLASAYCPGPNLQQWLDDRPGPQSPSEAAEFVAKIAAAADFAHENGVIHRDLKPSNILLMPVSAQASDSSSLSDFEPRLTDFGLSRLVEDGMSTRSSMRLGTPMYMAPEQALGKRDLREPALDIYSLGVMLYRLLTGRLPYRGVTEFEVVEQIVNTPPQAPIQLSAKIPRDLNSICLKCIEKDPRRRYLTAAELSEDLLRFLRREPTMARPVTWLGRSLRWVKRARLKATLLFVCTMSFITAVAALGFHLRTVELQSADLLTALNDANTERETARKARIEADLARNQAESEREYARRIGYRSDIRLAFQLLEKGQFQNVQRLLSVQVPDDDKSDLRGPEWFVLNAQMQSAYHVIGEHEGAATECVLSPDRKVAYTAGTDGFVRTWDFRTGEEQNCFPAGIGEIHALSISPDGRQLAVGGKAMLVNAAVKLLSATTGESQSALQSHETTIESIRFSPDGRWLAAGGRYQPVQLTRLSDNETFTLPSDRRNRTVSFSADSRYLAVGSSSAAVQIWPVDQEKPGEPVSVPGYSDGKPYIVQFSPRASWLATGYVYHNFISVFEQPANTRRWLAMGAQAHNGSARFKSLAFSPDMRHLAAGDAAGTVVIWNLTGKDSANVRLPPAFAASPHQSTVSSMQFIDESNLLTTGEDGRVCITSPFAQGATLLHWPTIQMTDAVVAGDKILLSCVDGSVRHKAIADLPNLPSRGFLAREQNYIDDREPNVLFQDSHEATCLGVSPDGEAIAVGNSQGGVQLFNRNSGMLLAVVAEDRTGDDVAVRDVAFSADGKQLAFTGQNEFVSVVNLASGRKVVNSFVGNGYAVEFFAQDQQLAVTSLNERVDCLNTADGTLVRSISAAGVRDIRLSPDGRTLVCIHDDGRCTIADTRSEVRQVIAAHRQGIEALAFSANGSTLMTVDWTGFLVFTDLAHSTVLGRVYIPDLYNAEARILCREHMVAVLRCEPEPSENPFRGTQVALWTW